MQLVDSHCHVHESEFADKFNRPADLLLEDALSEGVSQVVCVGTTLIGSEEALEFCKTRPNCYASAALHPHEVERLSGEQLKQDFARLSDLVIANQEDFVAIGECGLDYFYHESKTVRSAQKELFRGHIELALSCNLPLIFHIRSAFTDFFEIIDDYQGIRGVVHSFSAGEKQLEGCLQRGLFIGLNGIMTFTKDQLQLAAAAQVPLDKLLLETDAPFLTPAPFRGTICEPKHVRVVAEFLCQLRGETLADLAAATSGNAKQLFNL
jgi:TatD DNase family protein